MYERFLDDPGSVDTAWHEFFADYSPDRPAGRTAPAASDVGAAAPTPAPAADSAASATAAPPKTSPNGTAPTSATPAATSAGTSGASPSAKSDAMSTGDPAGTSGASAGTSGATSGGTPGAKPAPGADRAAAQQSSPDPAADKPAAAKPADKPAAGTAQSGPSGKAPQQQSAQPLRGAAARVVANMESSLTVPTATSVRAVPAKLLIDNRIVINNHLRRARGGKVSFTHLIGYAMVKALRSHPEMNNSFGEVDGRPALVTPEHVNLGLAIDLQAKNGSRSLVVAALKGSDGMDFAKFLAAYEDIIRRARQGKLTADDFAGTTISLTNPGTIGTEHSVPRLMQGQGTIIGVGAMEYPAAFSGMSEEALAQNAVSRTVTLTSTYDHRIIQGAQSGEFLKRMHELLLGGDEFYDEIFNSLRIPYEPVRWVQDQTFSHEGQIDKAARVIELINAYRTNGHLMADTDPLEFKIRSHPDLDVIRHGLTLWDLDRVFPVGGFAGERTMALRDILGVLRDAYCRRVGVEYMHITDPEERRWLQQRIEVKHDQVDREEQKHVLGRLNAAEAFETFLQTKYVGQRRFSLEGAESVIPLLDAVLTEAANEALDEVVIGMPHRGRLNVLANIVGKSYGKIFAEFEGNIDPRSSHGSGDVKYHLGSAGVFKSRMGSTVKVSLTANPSHLEAVNPVVEGIVRAKQDLIDKGEAGFTVLPVLMHGDAAFAGQGVIAETLNLSQLRGYRTGGTVHLVVNNQVGFTTSPAAARSSIYSTDVARMIQAPIFHVNGDDPEACVRVAKLAVDYRREFKKDVVIDMVCYRRRGHNETDNPSFTQPLMYDIIDKKRSVRKLYTEALIGRGDITLEEAEEALRDFQDQLERVFVETRDASGQAKPAPDMTPPPPKQVDTSITPETMKRIGDAFVSLPDGFEVHPRLKPQLDRRGAMAIEGHVDWSFGELLAFGATVLDGVPVRLAGQDSRRGTFSQRHSVLIDRNTGEEHTPLKYLDPGQAQFWVYDSLLSEFAAVGFEYGYSVANPEALVCWEAQFGDFIDGAQTITDEFISSGEAKWGQRSRVALLLPHGYEGQGPDHSSARIERFLQMCAEDNITVANCSTPANYFHLLRRQALAAVRPLVVFTPKSLLRLRAATSAVEDFTTGRFAPVLADPSKPSASEVTKVLVCSGKVYYDLESYRQQNEVRDTAILRLEQLHPFPGESLSEALAAYPSAEVRWVQEEPENMGAWTYVAFRLPALLGSRPQLTVRARPASASPAAGSSKTHEAQQRGIVESAFAD
ncbi:MAG TPA: multifunctional oxoglutarate decarboxylase/oxoglutarate dehydrogenase thiamine pyrophosphate-binding subunit/dihydrolipoyllysine-residue succinyltransferase subunit [Mycobacteriales bacterium]|nr:multifunctional oxoglutarate decarboxylase/oxoglutarate dehydrogenase thiamine pyrophosphate-binding subunit/dihydrolipoyllysine-residue succinyltransferase subunit [Mycobacteriales bacterium]